MTVETSINHVEQAQGVIESIKNRTIYFSCSHIFGDPAWEIMTVLFLATEQGRSVIAAEICENASMAYSIVSRWLKVLEKEGLVACNENHGDSSLNGYSLTDQAVVSFRHYLDGNQS